MRDFVVPASPADRPRRTRATVRVLLLDPDDADEVARGMAFHDRVVRRALAHGGTCTGEHGVGYGKSRYLEAEHGAAGVRMMQAIKRALDPDDLFNPGKIADAVGARLV